MIRPTRYIVICTFINVIWHGSSDLLFLCPSSLGCQHMCYVSYVSVEWVRTLVDLNGFIFTCNMKFFWFYIIGVWYLLVRFIIFCLSLLNRDHSYITSALVGGGGGSENANFCLFLVLKTCWRRGEGGPKIPKMWWRNIWMVPK
mgnify:CR=1 FL=1